MKTAIIIALLVVAVIMTVVICMQEAKQSGLGSLGGTTETYWSKNKNRSKEGVLDIITKVCAVLFFVLALVLSLSYFN